MPSRIIERYRKEVVPALRKQFGYPTLAAIPKVEKVVVNVGIGRVSKDAKTVEKIQQDLTKITGQKPAVRPARKSISGFKLRAGTPIGLMVTLRGTRMYDFMDRLISVALPRSRDFRGLDQKSVDGHGNLTIGLREHSIFPEVTYESLKDIFGLEVTVVTNAGSREKGVALLKLLGFPMKG